MSKLLLEQLAKVRGVDLPYFDEQTEELLIKRKNETPLSLAIGKAYLLEVENYIINPPNGFNLHANWNKGIAPRDKYLYSLIVQDIGKMIRIESYGYDINRNCILMNSWSGWLPKKSVKVIKEVQWRV